MLGLFVHLHVFALTMRDRLVDTDDERGQTTAEYALVLLGAAAVAVAIGGWAASGGKVGKLLDSVFDYLVKQVKS